MADNTMTPPPARNNGGLRRGVPAEKPKNMKGTLKRLYELTKGSRKGLGWILLLSACASASSVLSPYLIGEAVNAIDAGNPAVRLILLLAAFYVGDWLVRFLQQFFMASIGQRMILHIRMALFGAMKKLPLSYFDRKQHGELMSRLTNDVDNISVTISDSLAQLMTYAFTIVGILVIMISLSPLLTCIALVSVVLVFLLTRTVTRHTRKLYSSQQAILGKLNGHVEESVSGLSMVKAYGREAAMVETFEENNEKLCKVATQAMVWSGFLMPLTNVINNFSYVAIAIISGIMAAKGTIEVGMITSFLLYSRQFARPFVDIANIYNNFQTAVAGAERVFEMMDEEPEPADREDPVPLTHPKGDIRFEHVTFAYTKEKPVLRDISFHIPEGTQVAIVGPTGSGKTTIINLLTRFYDVNGGAVFLDGHDIRDYPMQSLREAFGVVLQDSSLFEMSVRDNLSYGQKDVPFEKIQAAAVMAGADSFITRLPQGYDTVLAQGGAALSQGERQLLTIARAILADAPILILDEATSSVDTLTEQKIQRAMRTITKGRTSFLIAHRLSTIRDSDVIIFLRDGKIAEKGTHEELMALNGEYAGMYRTQTGME
ncbi:MAG: ABC transporter ATP-binding protein [Eubacteriales bacterium]|nr:ABC transporter ATP-binding protein [Eubacteriales bacterium]